MSMGLMFSWATKEYLLWEMSLGQIILYHNLGLELKYGIRLTKDGKKTLRGASYAEIRAAQEEARRQLAAARGEEEKKAENEKRKTALRAKYGEV